jgi:hypothetical protein
VGFTSTLTRPEEARAIMCRVGGESCQCGCASGSDDSAGGDSDESVEIGEEQVRKRLLNKAMEVYRDSVRELMEQEESQAARKRPNQRAAPPSPPTRGSSHCRCCNVFNVK